MGIWTSSKKAKHQEHLQDKQNQANMELHMMDNNFNERMAEKANQWNIEQWNREVAQQDLNWQRDAEYNSASAQVERYREAGLNPTIMMQGQGAGSSSSQSVPHASSASASAAGAIPMGKPDIPYPDYNQVFGNLQSSLNQFVDSTLKVEQVQGMKLDNERKQQQMLYELQQAKNNARGTELENFLKEQEYQLKDALNTSLIDEAKYKAETQQYIRDQQKQVAEYQRLVTANAPERLAAELVKIKFDSKLDEEKKIELGLKYAEEMGLPKASIVDWFELLFATPVWKINDKWNEMKNKSSNFVSSPQQPIYDIRQ